MTIATLRMIARTPFLPMSFDRECRYVLPCLHLTSLAPPGTFPPAPPPRGARSLGEHNERLSRRVHGGEEHANESALPRQSCRWSHRTVQRRSGYSPSDLHDGASSEGWALGRHRQVADR